MTVHALARAVLLLALSRAGTAAAQAPPPSAAPRALDVRLAVGGASFVVAPPGGPRRSQAGLALEARARYRMSPLVGVDYTLTWGLTDWDRAGEWIDAGNRSGRWTTDAIRSVGDWAVEDEKTAPLRLAGAIFADLFLVASYAAVPACYLGSVGGATSHLQVDVTANLHADTGAVDAWVEGGLAGLALPSLRDGFDVGLGPVVGLGVDAGDVRLGARVTWSPEALHTARHAAGDVVTAAATLSLRR
jgi:hypothetical protein